jgi:hypothetical protein
MEEDFVDMRKILYQDKETQNLKIKLEKLQAEIRILNDQKYKLSSYLEELKLQISKRKNYLYQKYLYDVESKT